MLPKQKVPHSYFIPFLLTIREKPLVNKMVPEPKGTVTFSREASYKGKHPIGTKNEKIKRAKVTNPFSHRPQEKHCFENNL